MATPRKRNKAAAKGGRTGVKGRTPTRAGAARKKPGKATSRAAEPKAGVPETGRTKATRQPAARERLNAVKPSGRRDESFFELVHAVARQIPKGRVTSYGAIAAALGTKLSARMVGWAMIPAHHAYPPVPAHRVVNRNGLLTGRHHYNPPERMQQLLEKDGVAVKDDQVVDFEKLFWDPLKEL